LLLGWGSAAFPTQDYLQNLMRAHFDADVGLFSVFEGTFTATSRIVFTHEKNAHDQKV